jgi:hypothetical protein
LFSNYSPGITAIPFVISTGAQRSGEISAWMLEPLPNVMLEAMQAPEPDQRTN